MIASPYRISLSSTLSESCCPWYGHNAFGTSLISSGHPATIMSTWALTRTWVIFECKLIILFLLSIDVYMIDRDV